MVAMGILVKYTGRKAIHSAGVDVGPNFIHMDLDGEAVELPDDLAAGLLRDQPQAFKKIEPKKTVDKAAADDSEKKDK